MLDRLSLRKKLPVFAWLASVMFASLAALVYRVEIVSQGTESLARTVKQTKQSSEALALQANALDKPSLRFTL